MANPEIALPYCMIGSIALNGMIGFGFLLTILFCMGDMQVALDNLSGFPIIEIFCSVTGSAAASTAMTSILILAAWLATIALLASTARMLWSLARDKGIRSFCEYFPN
jgi:amino acid transporter